MKPIRARSTDRTGEMLRALEAVSPPRGFDSYLRDLTFVETAKDELTVGGPGKGIGWITRRYRGLVEECARSIVGPDAKVVFPDPVVDGSKLLWRDLFDMSPEALALELDCRGIPVEKHPEAALALNARARQAATI